MKVVNLADRAQPGRAHLGRPEQLRGQHRVSRPARLTADQPLLPQPLTGSDAGHHRALDQPLAAAALRAELLECRLTCC